MQGAAPYLEHFMQVVVQGQWHAIQTLACMLSEPCTACARVARRIGLRLAGRNGRAGARRPPTAGRSAGIAIEVVIAAAMAARQ